MIFKKYAIILLLLLLGACGGGGEDDEGSKPSPLNCNSTPEKCV